MRQAAIKIVLSGIGFFYLGTAFAQKDTSGKGGVTIVSSFKPVLREAAKINFNASPPAADTAKARLDYTIPNQNLALAYQPGSLKPLALSVDSAVKFDNSSYIKAGFGSLRTPFVQAGISLGDGETAGLNIYAKHLASESKRDYQKFSSTNLHLSGYFKSGNNLQWDAGLGMKRDRTYKYGYLPSSLVLSVDSLKQSFQTISGRLAFHNINKTEFGLTYAPEVKIDVFSDNHKNSESNTVVNAPLEKTIGKAFAVNLGITFDLTRYSPDHKSAVNNTMYFISPSVIYKTAPIRVQAGIRPSWDNGRFKMFPNILAEIGTGDKRFNFQAGWTGYVRKTTYQYLASGNPWLWTPDQLRNTWIEERFAGFKGAVDDHFSYAAKVGFNRINNQPLFINDTSAAGDGKSFKVVYEDKMNVLNLGWELGYTAGEKFSLIAGLQFNQYTGLQTQAKAWGMIPLELKAALRLQVIRDLWLKTDLFAWRGARYLMKNGDDDRLKGAVDLNAGLEFKITKNINLWAQFNNLFNKEYQRWNQYPVYGFNFVGGVVFSFDQKN
ncbi:MAG: TonB-dependent receptor [Sphingobacteriales bacterium]|nr:TonB-dependent receptor [Sphingobacteriales bacterium]